MQQETRREIVDRLLRYVGETNDADARALANDLCATAVSSIWRAHPFTEFVMPTDYVVATVPGQPLYVLPTYFGRIAGKEGTVRNLTTGARIYPRRGRDLEEEHSEIGGDLDTTTADPAEYTISGKVGVNVQVASAGEVLEVLSSSAADVDVDVQLEGLFGGQWTTFQGLLLGATPVNIGTWTYVQTFAKAYQATSDPVTALTSSRGTVTLRKVAGAVTRQTLLPHESSREQFQLRLFHTPQSVQRIGIPIIRLPRRVFQDADPIPALWGDAVFEHMHIGYRVSTGELSITQGAEMQQNGPQLQLLIGYDNELKPGVRVRKRAFGGMR